MAELHKHDWGRMIEGHAKGSDPNEWIAVFERGHRVALFKLLADAELYMRIRGLTGWGATMVNDSPGRRDILAATVLNGMMAGGIIGGVAEAMRVADELIAALDAKV